MHKIKPWLYIGKYRETLNQHLLSAYKIGAMLQLAERVEQTGIASLYLAVEDGISLPHNLLRQGVDFILAEKGNDKVVLIACGAGISRSSAFAVAAIKENEEITLLEAFKLIKQYHTQALPHQAIWESLCDYYQEDTSFLDIMRLR